MRVTCRMEGDTFEMEDQRNWMDASYKTYVRPLALPWPYPIEQGHRFTQSVTLTVEGALPAVTAAGAEPVTVSVGQTVAAHDAGRRPGAAGGDMRRRRWRTQSCFAWRHRRSWSAGSTPAKAMRQRCSGTMPRSRAGPVRSWCWRSCCPASTLPANRPTIWTVLRSDLRYVQDQIAQAGVQPARIAVSPACDLQCTLPGGVWPKAPSWEEVATAARAAFPGTPLGGGMFSYFTELNRKRPPAGPVRLRLPHHLPHRACRRRPVVDRRPGGAAVHFRQHQGVFAGDAPYWLFPTTLAMRQNPYGAAPAENPHGGRVAMARVDPREHALIGAAWYAGYLAHAARAGLAGVTLAAAAGPSGIVARDGTGVHPSFHVIRGHAALAGAAVLETRSSAPREVQALAVRTGDGLVLWLTNLTGRQQEVRLEGLASDGPALSLQLLEETSMEAFDRDPESWSATGRRVTDRTVELPPYAVAMLGTAGA